MTPFRILLLLLRSVLVIDMGLVIISPVSAEPVYQNVADDIDWAAAGIRVEYDNDLLVNSDDKFTSGFSAQWHSRAADSWDLIKTPGWMKIGQHLPGMQAFGLHRRVGLALGHNMQTPKDLGAVELVVDDVPYAGTLGFELNWIAFDDDVFLGYALIVGVIGPSSGAERLQKWIHKMIGGDKPMGWANQIPDEPAINFNGMFKKKVVSVQHKGPLSADLALNADFGLGTAMTFGEVATEIRAGWNLPTGFTFVPDPVGRTIAYNATAPNSSGNTSVYASVVHRRIYMRHFVFLDGSLWRETHSVDYDRWQYQTIMGLHLTRGRWGVHLSFWNSSSSVRTALAPDGNDFGTIAFEWRF